MTWEWAVVIVIIVLCVSAVTLEWIKRKYPDGS